MHKNTNALVKAIRFATLTAFAAPSTVLAGGFALNEQSASAMGTANAGAAANPENASIVIFNPAGMSQLSGTNISFGAAVLDIDAEAKPETIQVTRQVPGVPVDPSGNGGDIADAAILPSFYLTHEVNDRIDVGFGLHAPYGLAGDYERNFSGRYFADKTELTAIAFTPSIALNNGKGLSMGVGLNIMYIDGRVTRFMDNSGTNQTSPNGAAPNVTDEGYADIEGDDIAVTFRVGFLYELNESTQLGLTAQTGTTVELKGDATFTDVSVQGPTGTPFEGVAVPLDSTEPALVPLAIPESIAVGIRHKLNDEITLLAGATYSKWSRFSALDIYGRDASQPLTSQSPGGMPNQLTHIPEEWKNTWQLNVGGIWQATPEWAFKAGYAFDQSPVDEFVTARIPSTDRHWLTLGTQWKHAQSGWTVDAAVGTLLFKDDPKVSDRSYVLTPNGTIDNPTDPFSSYEAEYDVSAWGAAIEFSKAF
ncbi:OmpP1/FadL family transporter [Marinobacter alkaliphilus]|uniref:OmpP1/FadL family transporter n=1 Tax=Marinobacter alkaliphilus TaxID=254719 RepID=UPI003D767BDF